jgi:hypothetical protein
MHKRCHSRHTNNRSRYEIANRVRCLSKQHTTLKQAKRSGLPWTGQHEGVGVEQAASPHYLSRDMGSLISFAVESHLQTQRSAVKMLHERILLLVKYVSDVIAGLVVTNSIPFSVLTTSKDQAPKDHATLRALTALIASLPATENKAFREEFETVRCLLYANCFHFSLPEQMSGRSTRTSN